ncbi:MAG: hypothetical protein AAGN66_25380 [Acidobacteriota bacterium]
MSMSIPEPTLRLFDGFEAADLLDPAHRGFLTERLLEDGDTEDLRWLLTTVPEADLAAWFERRGAGRLSRRSRVFWGLVLGRDLAEPSPRTSAAAQVWNL